MLGVFTLLGTYFLGLKPAPSKLQTGDPKSRTPIDDVVMQAVSEGLMSESLI